MSGVIRRRGLEKKHRETEKQQEGKAGSLVFGGRRKKKDEEGTEKTETILGGTRPTEREESEGIYDGVHGSTAGNAERN